MYLHTDTQKSLYRALTNPDSMSQSDAFLVGQLIADLAGLEAVRRSPLPKPRAPQPKARNLFKPTLVQ